MPNSANVFVNFPWDLAARRVYSQTNIPDLNFHDNFAAFIPGIPHENFALVATSTISLVDSGSHRFCTASDDGSWLYVDGRLLVNNQGQHIFYSVCADVQLAEGLHNISVMYFQGTGGAYLEATMDGFLIAPNGKYPAPDVFHY